MAAVELAKKAHVHTGAGSAVADAADVDYDGTAAGLAATDVQAAVDEVSANADAAQTTADDHIGTAADAHDGSAVSFTDAGLAVITGVTDVQAALAAVDAALDDRPTNAEVSAAYASAAVVGAKVQRSTTQSIPDATFTAVSFDTETWDSDGFHESVTNPSRMTMDRTGKGLFTVRLAFDASSVGRRIIGFYKNGAEAGRIEVAPLSLQTHMAYSDVFNYVATDYFQVQVYQSSGGPLTLSATGAYKPTFSYTHLGS